MAILQNSEAGARVVALEPAPPNFRYLLWNLRVRQTTTLGDPKLLFLDKPEGVAEDLWALILRWPSKKVFFVTFLPESTYNKYIYIFNSSAHV